MNRLGLVRTYTEHTTKQSQQFKGTALWHNIITSYKPITLLSNIICLQE